MKCPKCSYIRTDQDSNPEWQCPACHIAYSKFLAKTQEVIYKYTPNFVPLKNRLFCFVGALFLLIYGGYGLSNNHISVRFWRARRPIHLYDEAALIMYAAFVCASIVMIFVIIDHYDKRDNELRYQTIYQIFTLLGISLFAASFAYYLFSQ